MKVRLSPRAFTLIEVLVVVAIIALLVAILLPSLRNARNQAKLLTCKANESQIAKAIMAYQAESNAFVPIMYNHWAYQGSGWDKPARTCALSVALTKYTNVKVKLKEIAGGMFDPDKTWDGATVNAYQDRIMPEFFACPYERGKGAGQAIDANTDANFGILEWQGRFDSYHTWLWQNIERGKKPDGNWPLAAPHQEGVPQYSVLTWNRGISADPTHPTNFQHRRWSPKDAQKVKAPSLADVTVVFCAQGEQTQWRNSSGKIRRANVGSHYTLMGGGSSVIFADGHVGWVVGTRVGWP